MSYPPPPQPQFAGQPPQGGKQRLRGRTPLRLGLIFLILGIAAIVVGGILVGRKFTSVDGFKRVSIASGTGTVNLNGTGKWVVYYEASDVNDSITKIPQIGLVVTSPSGKSLDVSPYRGKNKDGKIDRVTYNYDGHKGVAAAQINVTEKGSYKVQAQAQEQLPSGADLAFGRDVIDASTVGGAVAIGGGVILLIAAIVLLIVGLVKRSRHKKEIAAGGNYGGYGGPPPGYQQAGPPQGYQQGGPPQGYPQGDGPQPGYPQGEGPQPGRPQPQG